MNSTSSRISPALAGRLALGAGAAFAAEGVVQLVHRQDTGSKVVGLAGHLNIGFFIIALLLVAPVFPVLARFANGPRAALAARAIAGGTALLGLTCITSLVMGHDGPWFVVIAPLTNAAWLFGSIALAVSLKRAGRVPALVAVGLPLAWIASIPLAGLGGDIVTGAYFLWTGVVLGAGAQAATAEPALA